MSATNWEDVVETAYCDIEHCEAPATCTVEVSEDKPSDSRRNLCEACHSAYLIGLQHGSMRHQTVPQTARATPTQDWAAKLAGITNAVQMPPEHAISLLSSAVIFACGKCDLVNLADAVAHTRLSIPEDHADAHGVLCAWLDEANECLKTGEKPAKHQIKVKVWMLNEDTDENGTSGEIYGTEAGLLARLSSIMRASDPSERIIQKIDGGQIWEAWEEWYDSPDRPYMDTYDLDEHEFNVNIPVAEVFIDCRGGVAYLRDDVPGVQVEIIDHDNEDHQ